MTPRRGFTGDRQNLSPAIPRETSPVPGDRNPRSSYPPGRSTHGTPAQRHKSIDVTGDPGDRTAISTTRDVREEILYGPDASYEGMCPHSCREIFSAHEAEGPKQPPQHPYPPDLRCIWCADQRDRNEASADLSPAAPGPTPGPEPVGAIAERVLDDLAARQREALNRLRRQAQPKEPR